MVPLLLLIAFILGFAAYRMGLPPLVGYLIAGFVLRALGVEGGDELEEIADLGVMLLLFSIGLKLKLRSLLKPEVWAGASVHMASSVLVLGAGVFALSFSGLSAFTGLDFQHSLMIGFALSFSSTVFAVKVLEEKGDMSALHGHVSIGILIMQDIFAVLFMTFSTGKIPSPWAIALVAGLLAGRPLLMALLDRVGHRELLMLFGIVLALGLGAGGFELVDLKPDLGALFVGILVASHPKAEEIAKVLLSFKDLLLVGFFLSIGLSGAPTLQAFGIAGLLVAVVPLKVALFFVLLTRFKLRARTSVLASLNLATYSEFGLLVAAIAIKSGWIATDWLIILAIAVSISFVLASPLNAAANFIFERYADRLRPFETVKRHPDDQPIDIGGAEIAVFGMGRVGTSAYEDMRAGHGDSVIGVDFDAAIAREHLEAGRRVILGDPSDVDFWERAQTGGCENLRLVMLTMPNHTANLAAVTEIVRRKPEVSIAAIAQFDDEVEELKEAGAHAVYNFYAGAGFGFAERIRQTLSDLAGSGPGGR